MTTAIVVSLCIQLASLGQPAEPRVLRDVVYAEVDGTPLALDLYLPRNAQQAKLIVWVHGGA